MGGEIPARAGLPIRLPGKSAGKSTSHNGFGILLTPDNVDSEIEHRRTELAQWKAYYEANGTLPFRGMEDTGSLIPKIYG